MPGEQLPTPPVTWAQRKNLVYVNIILEDSKEPTLKIEKNKLVFKGKGGPDQKDHELNIELFSDVKPDDSKFIVRARGTEIVLIKEDQEASYWPRLTKEQKKYHWLKVDFSKWKDEDESDDESAGPGAGAGGPPGGGDFEEMMRQMGGMGGLGGGMGGMGGMPGMGGMGMPGMGGMGMPGMGGDFGDLEGEGDSDDEELPDLEEAKDDKESEPSK